MVRAVRSITDSISYGVYFLTQLIQAASLLESADPLDYEDLQDERYNIRDKTFGLNMDFMSYSNFIAVDRDPRALLDSETMINNSRSTFQTFFQHYASRTRWTDGQLIAYDRLEADGKNMMTVTTSERIEILTMSSIATWLCVAILALLIIILAILMVSLKFVYPHNLMQHNVRCLDDAIAMVEASHGFLEQVARYGPEGLKESDIRSKLGWFRDKQGQVRWGIEIVDHDDVHWAEKPGNFSMRSSYKSVSSSQLRSIDEESDARW